MPSNPLVVGAWAVAALLGSAAALAQTAHDHSSPDAAAAPAASPAPATRNAWRDANAAVGTMPRGHADIVAWERTRGLHRPPADEPGPDQPWTLDDVARAALRQAPELRIEPGEGAVAQAQRQQAAAQTVLQAQRAWLDAVTARALRRLIAREHEAAELAAELAQRMQQVGNFSAERALRERLPLHTTAARLQQAQLEERQTLIRLWQRLGVGDTPEALLRHLPTQLPARAPLPTADDLPRLQAELLQRHPLAVRLRADAERSAAGMPSHAQAALQAAWDAAVTASAPDAPALPLRTPRWPHTWGQALQTQADWQRLQRQLVGDLHQAWHAAQTAETQLTLLRDQLQPAQRQLQDEAVLRYNGMLISTWELLATVRQRLQAEQALLQAERGAWDAQLMLRAVQAGLPYTPTARGATPADATPADQGH